MIRRFAHRFAVSSLAGATLAGAVTTVWLLAHRRGLAGRPGSESPDDKREPTVAELTDYGAAGGALFGAGHAFARPLLPRPPEAAGVLYAISASFAIRVQLNALFKALDRPQRFRLTPAKLAGDLLMGLWLAQAERLLGPRRR